MKGILAAPRSRAPDPVEDGLPSLCRGELGVAPQLGFERDPPDVFAHLCREPHPLRRPQAAKNRELRGPSLVRVGGEHPERV